MLGNEQRVLGKCPVCGGEVIDEARLSFYGCANWRREAGGCRFRINKVYARRPLTPSDIRALLRDGHTTDLRGFMSGSGKEFGGVLELDASNRLKLR